MIRNTSVEAYHAITSNGLLSKRRMQVYDILFKYGPLTANEAFEILKEESKEDFRFDSNTRARFTELRELGVAVELGTKECSVTGMNTILWDVTDRLPKPPSQREKIIKQIETTEKRLERLREKLSEY